MFFMIGSICIMREDIQVDEECCQACKKVFVGVMLEKSDIGKGKVKINSESQNVHGNILDRHI